MYICSNEEELKRHLAYGTAHTPVPLYTGLDDDLDENYMLKNMDDIRMWEQKREKKRTWKQQPTHVTIPQTIHLLIDTHMWRKKFAYDN